MPRKSKFIGYIVQRCCRRSRSPVIRGRVDNRRRHKPHSRWSTHQRSRREEPAPLRGFRKHTVLTAAHAVADTAYTLHGSTRSQYGRRSTAPGSGTRASSLVARRRSYLADNDGAGVAGHADGHDRQHRSRARLIHHSWRRSRRAGPACPRPPQAERPGVTIAANNGISRG